MPRQEHNPARIFGKWFVALILGTIAAFPCLHAQNIPSQKLPLPPFGRYVFQDIGTKYGLESKSIHTMMQDRTGYIWIGSENELYRFDGGELRTVRTMDKHALGSVEHVEQAPNGKIYVITTTALYEIEGMNARAINVPFAFPGAALSLQRFAIDGESKLWIVSSKGLAYLDADSAGSLKTWTRFPGLNVDGATAITRTTGGWIYFGLKGHLCRIRKGMGEPVVLPADIGLPDEAMNAMLEDGDGTLWVNTRHKLYRRLRGERRFELETPQPPNSNEIASMSIGMDGQLLYPTVHGLYIHNKNGWTQLGREQGLPTDVIITAIEDRNHTLLLGLGGAGIFTHNESQQWMAWTTTDGLPDDVVWNTVRDKKDRLWVGTNNGLGIWDPQTDHWRILLEQNGLSGHIIRHVRQAKDGSIWVLSFPGGVDRIDPETYTIQKITLPQKVMDVTCLLTSPNGDIYLCGRGFLLRVTDGKTPVQMQLPEEVLNTTFSAEVTPNGSLWTFGRHGLAHFDGKEWKLFTKKDGLLDDGTVEHGAALNDEVWFTYRNVEGASRVQLHGNQIQVKHYTTADGISSNDVFVFGRDLQNNIWIGGDNGLSVLSPEGKWRRYNRGNGLIWNDISSDGFRLEEDGGIMIGTSRGLAHFQPMKIVDKEQPPPVVITHVEVGKRSFEEPTSLDVAWQDRAVIVDFAALSYQNIAAIECQTRMGGPDANWMEQPGRQIHLAALESGQYELDVRCRKSHSDVDEWSAPASLILTIHPPWWNTWTAWLMWVILAVALFLLGVRMRTHGLEQDRKSLEEAVKARSTELEKANRELQEAAITDPLTGLRNRRYFQAVIPTDVSQAQRAHAEKPPVRNRDLIFCLIDLDHFKLVNDEMGHDAGDSVLVETARRLRQVVRDSDYIVRWGGEEFLIVSRNSDRNEAETLVGRILYAIGSTPFTVRNGPPIYITCSLGWAPFPFGEGVGHEQVLHNVDDAMYEAKQHGRNQSLGILPAVPGLAGERKLWTLGPKT